MNSNRSVNLWLALTLIVVGIAGIVFLQFYERKIETEAKAHLTTMLMLRDSVLTSHFESLRSEVTLWSSRPVVIDLMNTLLANSANDDPNSMEEFGTLGIDEFKAGRGVVAGQSIDDRVTAFAAHHDYYDVFFVSRDGEVLYTIAKQPDYRTNLINGPLSDSGLGRLFRELHTTAGEDRVAFSDFTLYPPSDNKPAAFLGARVYDGNNYLGIYAVQIPETTVDSIMQFSSGMGESGETYLVGDDNLMRSNSRFLEESAVMRTRVVSPSVAKGLAREIGIQIVDDYRGVSVYSAYRDFDFEGTRWAVLAEQDVAEVLGPVNEARWWLGAAFVLLTIVALMMRYLILRMVLPTSIVAFFGLSALQHLEDD